MFIFNVLPLREFRSPKSQFAMVNVCVLSMYYHVLLFQISDDRQRTPGNWSESSRIHSIRPHTPRMMQNSHQLLTYLHYVSEAWPGRERSGIPANYANSTQFATQSVNYAKFTPFVHIIHYISDAWPVAENAVKFQRIKQNPPNSPPYPANYANSAHFALKLTHM